MKKIILHEINKDLIEPLSENFYSFEFVYFQLSVKESTHYCEHMILTSGITKLLNRVFENYILGFSVNVSTEFAGFSDKYMSFQ